MASSASRRTPAIGSRPATGGGDEPRRRAPFAKAPRNALPPLEVEQSRLPADAPVAGGANNDQAKITHRRDLPTPLALSAPALAAAPSVPSQQTKRRAKAREPLPPVRCSGRGSSKLRELATRYLPRKELAEQWTAAHAPRPSQDVGPTGTGPQSTSRGIGDRQARQVDYDLYLYFASKYGALDGVLYCCSPTPGRTYRCLVDLSARRLQRWCRCRMRALRRYWAAHLARVTTTSVLHSGLTEVSVSYYNEQIALGHLRRVRRQRAAKVLQRWHIYASRIIEVEARFAAACARDLLTRLLQWKRHVAAAKQFKRQLKTVARRKVMADALSQWQHWKQQHEKLRRHLCRQWLKIQRRCLDEWMLYTRTTRAAQRIQRVWRLRRWRRKRTEAGGVITAVVNGYLGRSRARELQRKVEVARTVIGLVEQLVWNDKHSEVAKQRAIALEKEIARASRERQCVLEAERVAEARVARDLSAAVRNAMHRELQDTMQSIKESHVASGNMKALKDKALLRSLAVEQLGNQQRTRARVQAESAFRDASDDNCPLDGCLICLVRMEDEHLLGNLGSVEHKCISIQEIALRPEGVRAYLDHFQAKELVCVQERARALGRLPGRAHDYLDARWPKWS